MTEARIGWGGEVWLSTDLTSGNLVELDEVVSFDPPSDEADEVEATHLKSPDKRKEFLRGLIDGGEATVPINYIPASDTHTLLLAAKAAGDARYVRFVIPDEAGDPEWKIDTYAWVKRFSPGTVAAGDKIEGMLTLRVTGAQTESAV